jgi:hypothetical protein
MNDDKLSQGIHRYRIVEWTSKFANRLHIVEYELQRQKATDSEEWEPLGTSRTLADARKALLFRVPDTYCGLA